MKTLAPKILLILLLLSLGLMVLDRVGVLETPKSAAQSVLLPVQGTVLAAKNGLAGAFSFASFWKSGEARIKNLELRVLELSAQKNRADALERENAAIRKQLGVASLSGRKMLPATVLGVNRYLEIGVGRDDGVKEGQSVVYLDNLIGRVLKVSGRAAFVQLPRDPEAKVAVRDGLVRGLAQGEFNSGVKITQVAQNEEIREGDLILTSGEGEVYVPGLVLGKVTAVKVDRTGLFKEASVVPMVDYSRLVTVFVVLD